MKIGIARIGLIEGNQVLTATASCRHPIREKVRDAAQVLALQHAARRIADRHGSIAEASRQPGVLD